MAIESSMNGNERIEHGSIYIAFFGGIERSLG